MIWQSNAFARARKLAGNQLNLKGTETENNEKESIQLKLISTDDILVHRVSTKR